MKYVGIDLHTKTSTICVMIDKRDVTGRRPFACERPAVMQAFFRKSGTRPATRSRIYLDFFLPFRRPPGQGSTFVRLA